MSDWKPHASFVWAFIFFLSIAIALIIARTEYGSDPFRDLETAKWECITRNRGKPTYVCPEPAAATTLGLARGSLPASTNGH
jgi:hypothetical protein